jgi:hypothetical protein
VIYLSERGTRQRGGAALGFLIIMWKWGVNDSWVVKGE